MVFGDLDDPNSDVAQLARSPRAFHLLEELGTRPKVTYLAEVERSGSSIG
jgi:molybdopterin-containing oxidoreductase family iron-sulfur binding subunit